MRSALRWAGVLLSALLLLALVPPAAHAADPKIPVPVLPDIPVSPPQVPGLSDCKEAPTPESPGTGIAGFFSGTPKALPPAADPFAKGATTTIYEQYGYAGLRWRTYDLGCGPDAMRNPDAVIGTSVSNWIMQAPLALTALTGSLTQVAFNPTFLDTFDPVVERVSSALHENLFASWIPAVLALLGGAIIFMARRSAFASTAAAVAWALLVVLVATALFRWPIVAGHAADATVTTTIGEAVGRLDGDANGTDPGLAVASQVTDTILYRGWLAGTLGSPDSATAKKYGPALFKAQALTWREAAEAQSDRDRAREILEDKQQQWTEVADQIKESDPEAYEHLTGGRSETRVGYAILSALAIFLSLPFLLLSALLMLGCFFIVRLAVMLFPAFAVLGVLPASRGLVTGLGKTVGAAVVNAIVFGIGAGVTIAVLGILFNPGGGAPAWLSLVLMPLFSFIMWQALKPFRRLTSMVNPNSNHFASMPDSVADSPPRGLRRGKKLVTTAVAAATGGAAGAAAANALDDDDDDKKAPPERAEARPTVHAPPGGRATSGERSSGTGVASGHAAHRTGAGNGHPPTGGGPAAAPRDPSRPVVHAQPTGAVFEARGPATPTSHPLADPSPVGLAEGYAPRPGSPGVPPVPTEPEWDDGEAVYPIYRPTDEHPSDVA